MSKDNPAPGGRAGIEGRVLRLMRSQHMAEPGSRLLVGVSGGPDSVCLLHLLAGIRRRLGISLHVAHLDHGLRGAESDADRSYVLDLCSRLGLPVTAERADLAALRRRHSPIEETAREARYAFFCRLALEIAAGAVATGHTADDHLETVLLHLVRGAGTRGLAGIEPVSKLHCDGGELRLVRPLLQVRRAETEEYCRRFDLRPRLDSSNQCVDLLRNRVRLELLPLLRSYNPGFDATLARTARLAADESQAIDTWVDLEWPAVAEANGDGGLRLLKRRLSELPAGLRRALLLRALSAVRGSARDISAAHVQLLLEALERRAGTRLRLLGGVEAVADYDSLVVGPAIAPSRPLPSEYKLTIPGETRIPGWSVGAALMDGAEAGRLRGGDRFSETVDYEAVGPELTVRSRRDGDRFQPLGMPAAKKLQDFLVDARVPRRRRDEVPIVLSPARIVWVVGYRIDHRARLTPRTRRALRLRFRPI